MTYKYYIGGIEVNLSDTGLILLAAAVLCLALFIRSRRIQSYQDKLKQGIRTEQLRVSPAAAGVEAKTGKSLAELELGGFHPSERFIFDDRDRQAPVHVEFVVDQAGNEVAYSADGKNFEKRTFLQVNGCELKELREYSSMVDEINLGIKSQTTGAGTGKAGPGSSVKGSPVHGSSVQGASGEYGTWMDKASQRINSLQVILYTGRLMDAPTVLELFGRPHYSDYGKYAEAIRFARDVQGAVYRIISSRIV